jgi:hypothetical protein
MCRCLTTEQGKLIIENFREGLSLAKIARAVGCSPDGARIYLTKHIPDEYEQVQTEKWGKRYKVSDKEAQIGIREQCTGLRDTCKCSHCRKFRQPPPPEKNRYNIFNSYGNGPR